MKKNFQGIFTLPILVLLSMSPLTFRAFGQSNDYYIPASASFNSHLTVSDSSRTPELVWERLEFPVLPPHRTGFSLTYNPINRLVLLFGGASNGFPPGSFEWLNDLWLTDGRQWLEFHTANVPGKRAGASMAYDEARQTAVLFGGYDGQTDLNETWIFNGSDWTQLHPPTAPSPRTGAKMVYDPIRKVIYLFGGFFMSYPTIVSFRDMWIWDGQTWQQLFPSTLPAGSGPHIVFDPVHQNILLFGSGSSTGPTNDTWIWDGENWNEVSPVHHPDGNFVVRGMAYDEKRQQIFMVGYDNSNSFDSLQTWSWNGQDWLDLKTFHAPSLDMFWGSDDLVYLPDLQTVLYFKYYVIEDDYTKPDRYRTEFWALNSRYLSFFPAINR